MSYFRSYRRLLDLFLLGILFLTVSLSVASAWPSGSAMTQGEAALEATEEVTPNPSCDPNAAYNRASAPVFGEVEGTFSAYSLQRALSGDGRFVVFGSARTNLIIGGTNGVNHVFVYDRLTCQHTLASRASDGTYGNGDSDPLAISSNGRFVAFTSMATNLVPSDMNNARDVFLHDLENHTTQRISVSSNGGESNGDSYSTAISADGRYIAFESDGSNLVPDDTNNVTDIFVRDTHQNITTRVSVTSDGTEVQDHPALGEISADGRYIIFAWYKTNQATNSTSNWVDIFVHDRNTNTTALVQVAPDGMMQDTLYEFLSVSDDGNVIVFTSAATNVVEGDTNNASDVFIHDRTTGITTRVLATDGSQLNSAHLGTMSGDGRYIAFVAPSSSIILDALEEQHLFVYDRFENSYNYVPENIIGQPPSLNWISLSEDGRYSTINTSNTGLVPDDTGIDDDVFIARVTYLPTDSQPTPEVTAEPTEEPTPEVTAEPTEEPTPEVTAEPTEEPTPEVTQEPTEEPTPEVTAEPTEEPTPEITPTVSPDDAVPLRNLFTTGTLRLSWNRITWARGYHLQVSSSLNFSNPLYERTVGRNTLAAIVMLGDGPLPDGTYYWRVQAKREDGTWGRWSTPDTFTIDTN